MKVHLHSFYTTKAVLFMQKQGSKGNSKDQFEILISSHAYFWYKIGLLGLLGKFLLLSYFITHLLSKVSNYIIVVVISH